MITHKFITEYTYESQPKTQHTVTTDAETLADLVAIFEQHLRGAGFNVKIGSLQIVTDETESNGAS